MKQSFIIALDFPDLNEAKRFLVPFRTEKLAVKIGMELFYQGGPSIISHVKEQGHEIFLDLKLHDIPNTVKKAMRSLAQLEVDMVNVHAAGGRTMMEAALEGLESGTAAGKNRPLIIGVTQLTSTSQAQMNLEQNIPGTLEDSVIQYATLTHDAGLDGVVCSTHEVISIHQSIGNGFMTVTPGIRIAGDQTHDQHRVATPKQARDMGADAIVVGRAITAAKDPLQAYAKMKADWEGIRC